jgi:hypothetical protein
MIDFDLTGTIEKLESDYRGDADEYYSGLVKTCHTLRKKPLKDFTVEDLRIMIGQNIGLKYLIPLAVNELDINILSEGDYYEGDLLSNVLSSDENYWRENENERNRILQIIKDGRKAVKEFDTTREIKRGLLHLIDKFTAIYRANTL